MYFYLSNRYFYTINDNTNQNRLKYSGTLLIFLHSLNCLFFPLRQRQLKRILLEIKILKISLMLDKLTPRETYFISHHA